jgi:hypothetical protein
VTGDEDRPSKDEDRPSESRLTDGDKKLALITFGATAAANIATLAIAGLALLAYKFLRERYEENVVHHHGFSSWWSLMLHAGFRNREESIIDWVVSLVVIAVLFAFGFSKRKVLRNITKAALIIAGAIGILSFILYALGGLGALTSVH